jgi:hypothetical protein
MLHAVIRYDAPAVAGRIMYVDSGNLVLACTSYADEYRQLGVGIRLFDQSSQRATKTGYAGINLGGGHTYKAQWAPEGEKIWSFNIAPSHYPPR